MSSKSRIIYSFIQEMVVLEKGLTLIIYTWVMEMFH
jgi:hypothetical protein